MKKSLFIPTFLFFVSFLCPALAGSAWREFKTDFFSISFPVQPAQRGSTQWVAADSKGRAYSVNVTDLADAPTDPGDYFSQTVEKLSQSARYEVIYQKDFKGQGLPACEFKIANDKHIVVSRLFLKKNRLYMLQVATDTGTFEEKLLGKFFDSFRIHPSSAPIPKNPGRGNIPTPDSQDQAVQPW